MKLVMGILIGLLSLTNAHAFDHSHAKFDQVLGQYVAFKGQQSLVNYSGLKKNRSLLDDYNQDLSGVTLSEYNSFSRDQKLAFLINAYNSFTLQLIIDNYPIDSIKDIGSFFQSPWDKKFIKLLGKTITLNNIEHDIIRKKFDEPRIHFAVNCASIGCPSLITEPFVASKLDAQLEAAAKHFVQNSAKNRYDANKRTLYLSKIFSWYGGDFASVDKFVAKYITSSVSEQTYIFQGKARKKYLSYDWDLNDAK